MPFARMLTRAQTAVSARRIQRTGPASAPLRGILPEAPAQARPAAPLLPAGRLREPARSDADRTRQYLGTGSLLED